MSETCQNVSKHVKSANVSNNSVSKMKAKLIFKTNVSKVFDTHPRVSKSVKEQKLGFSPISVQVHVKTCQNVSKAYFLSLFFDTCVPVREVCKFVSKRVKRLRGPRNVYQSLAYPTQPAQKVSKRVKTCQKTMKI